jgi:hypothetical protein
MLESACRGFAYGFAEPRGAPFSDDYSTGAGGVGGTNDRTEVVRIFYSIEYDKEFGGRRDVVESGIFFFGSQCDDTLVRFHAREAVERTAILKSYGCAGGAGEIDNFLQAMAPGATGE